MFWTTILPFTTLAVLLIISPGPNGLLIAKTVPLSGRSAGFANILGFVASFYVHGIFSIMGVSLLLLQSATAFTIVKILGAAYLLWLGLKSLWSAFRTKEPVLTAKPAKRKRTFTKAFFEGFLTNLLNPKVSLFYLAAFPQFMSTNQVGDDILLLLVSIHAGLNALWFGGMVLLFAYLTRGAPANAAKRWLNGLTGAVFIFFSIKLATFRAS